jgi:hypothetical protein
MEFATYFLAVFAIHLFQQFFLLPSIFFVVFAIRVNSMLPQDNATWPEVDFCFMSAAISGQVARTPHQLPDTVYSIPMF